MFRLKRDLPFVDEFGHRTNPNQGDGSEGSVLFLGDSVTFGLGVGPSNTFVSLMNKAMPRVRMHNAGVNGYTTYNEVQYYVHQARALDPDVVVLGVCLNDIVNPRLHWGLDDVPGAAIPNTLRDLLVARPVRASALARLAHSALRALVVNEAEPSHLSGLSTLGMQAWVNRDSREHRWFRRQLDQLARETERRGARLLLVIFPIAYQLDSSGSLDAQRSLLQTCTEVGVVCIDLAPTLREHRSKHPFLSQEINGPAQDLWHLSVPGHEVVAAALQPALQEALRSRRAYRGEAASPPPP